MKSGHTQATGGFIFVAIGCLVAATPLVMLSDPARAADDAASLDRQQRAQQMAAGLVTAVIDLQLRQLEENGLQSSPIHAEVAAMRRNVDGLVQREMQGVVELLDRGVTTPVRRIVVRLAEERHKLLRRLKVADLAAQVRRLIDMQGGAVTAVRDLPRATDDREAKILTALDGQRTVRALCERLEVDLADMSDWGGAIGDGAADGLRLLKIGDVRGSLKTAELRLQATDFAATAQAQTRVVTTLESLLASVERTQGVVGDDAEQTVKAVQAAIAKVEAVRKEIAQSPLDDADVERLIAAQKEVQAVIEGLAAPVARQSDAAPLVAQAENAAAEAAAAIFEADKPKADAAEGKVLGTLRELAAALQNQDRRTDGDLTAEQLAQRLAALEKARDRTAAAAQQEQQAKAAMAADPRAAATAELEAAKTLAPTADDKPLPPAVARRLTEAQAEAQPFQPREAQDDILLRRHRKSVIVQERDITQSRASLAA